MDPLQPTAAAIFLASASTSSLFSTLLRVPSPQSMEELGDDSEAMSFLKPLPDQVGLNPHAAAAGGRSHRRNNSIDSESSGLFE